MLRNSLAQFQYLALGDSWAPMKKLVDALRQSGGPGKALLSPTGGFVKELQVQGISSKAACLLRGRPAPAKVPGTLLAQLRRAFSSQTPKKGFQNYYPRGTNKVPKPGEHKAEEAGKGGPGEGNSSETRIHIGHLLLFLGTGLYLYYLLGGRSAGEPVKEISFQEFKAQLLAQGLVAKVEVVNNNVAQIYVKSSGDPDSSGTLKYYFLVGSVDSFERKLEEAQREYGRSTNDFVPVRYTTQISIWEGVLELLPTLMLVGFLYWLLGRQMRSIGGLGNSRRGGRGGAGGFFNMVKANVSQLDKSAKDKITFKDVAGCDEAKVEIMEFVDFLKNPKKYKDLGATIPKGALLVGPPGTGKTLLAKATAGEAQVPFLSISGSDFMEMFVGVGPARVRDLFTQARSQAPSIIFIDEIDAIGRARGRGGFAGGNDERENTLNQLLVEMDGFSTTAGVVVLAGTNRPDILDKALLRPGRFDRTITVDNPDIKGREQIFQVHLKKLKLANTREYYSERLAALTPGFSGADIANVCNEAALVAARHNKHEVDLTEFESAIDRVIGGLEKKNKVVSKEERRTVAYHEAGHAVVSWFLEYSQPLLKVSIVPRGTAALGFAQYLPNEHLLMTTEQLLDEVCALLGGRASEQVMLGKISTGAVNDLERVTAMCYATVSKFGMNAKVGLVSFPNNEQQLSKPYSDDTARMIDDEVREVVRQAYDRTVRLVEEKKEQIEAMAQALLHKEVLNLDDVEAILGKRPYMSEELLNIDRYRHGNEGAADKKSDPEATRSPEPPPAEDDTSGEDEMERFRRSLDPNIIVAS